MSVVDDENDEVFDEDDLSEGFNVEVVDENGNLVASDEPEEDLIAELDADPVAIAELEDGDVEGDDVVEVEDEEVLVGVAVPEPDDDDEEDEDVEPALDEILAKTVHRTGALEESDDEEAVVVDTESLIDTEEAPLPRQQDEFRCSSCRLLKKNIQLADKEKLLCRDCV